MAILLITNTARTKALEGATSHIAKSSIKVEDNKHESNIKKGERFYLRSSRNQYYLLDVEGTSLYQFQVDRKTYNQLLSKHTLETGQNSGRRKTSKPFTVDERIDAFCLQSINDYLKSKGKSPITQLNKSGKYSSLYTQYVGEYLEALHEIVYDRESEDPDYEPSDADKHEALDALNAPRK